jgi:hypothetical protein
VVHVVEASTQEAATARESAAALVRDAKARTTLVEREARERVSRMEAEGASALAFACGEAEDLARRVAFLEGKLAEAHQAREVVEENSWGLSNAATNVE